MPTSATSRILVTGATGRLGSLVVDELLRQLSPANVVAVVRNGPNGAGSKASPPRAKGIETREADYDDPASLKAALRGIERLLLISSSELGVRVQQHRNVIDAAKDAGAKMIAYTSVLHADRSTLSVGEDHRRTEAMLAASGIPFVLLRNSWYTENLMSSITAALASGELLGAARHGRISSAERADFAAAAAAVMTMSNVENGRVYELAGDVAYSMAELAAEVSRQSGKTVRYSDLPEAEFKAALAAAGLPDDMATLLSSSHAAVAEGALFDEGGDLSRLIGRPVTSIPASVGSALLGLKSQDSAKGAGLGQVREIFRS